MTARTSGMASIHDQSSFFDLVGAFFVPGFCSVTMRVVRRRGVR